MRLREEKFVKEVNTYYERHGRRNLPWRKTRDPYRILVSEVMLQQTQVERVIPKYETFLKQFPTIHTLAEAPLGSVLRAWQGLGYNRRAKMLHQCMKTLVKNRRGLTPTIPETIVELVVLPGVGKYTAGAIMAFAFNKPVPIIETNIRSAYIYYFFKDDTDVLDEDILKVIERTLAVDSPRTWYAALMDYGTYIKRTYGNPNSRSKHHTRQSTFKGSDRQIRGAIIRLLSKKPYTRSAFLKSLRQFEDIRIDTQLAQLVREELITKQRKSYKLCE